MDSASESSIRVAVLVLVVFVEEGSAAVDMHMGVLAAVAVDLGVLGSTCTNKEEEEVEAAAVI